MNCGSRYPDLECELRFRTSSFRSRLRVLELIWQFIGIRKESKVSFGIARVAEQRIF